eukprot:scaffold4681_cov21-Tisochrysis_lutea.AAC.1
MVPFISVQAPDTKLQQLKVHELVPSVDTMLVQNDQANTRHPNRLANKELFQTCFCFRAGLNVLRLCSIRLGRSLSYGHNPYLMGWHALAGVTNGMQHAVQGLKSTNPSIPQRLPIRGVITSA